MRLDLLDVETIELTRYESVKKPWRRYVSSDHLTSPRLLIVPSQQPEGPQLYWFHSQWHLESQLELFLESNPLISCQLHSED